MITFTPKRGTWIWQLSACTCPFEKLSSQQNGACPQFVHTCSRVMARATFFWICGSSGRFDCSIWPI